MMMALHGKGGLCAFAVPLALSASLVRATTTSPKVCAGVGEAADTSLLQSRIAHPDGTHPLPAGFAIVSEMIGCAIDNGVSACLTDAKFEQLESLLPAVKDDIATMCEADREKLGVLLDYINTLADLAAEDRAEEDQRGAGRTTNPVEEAFTIVKTMMSCAMSSGVSECFTDAQLEHLHALLPAVGAAIASLSEEKREALGRLKIDLNTLPSDA